MHATAQRGFFQQEMERAAELSDQQLKAQVLEWP